MKSWVIHYRNKYPGGSVDFSDDKLDVYDAKGEHCVALRKNGAGGWSDISEEIGCKHKHCLAPIPKDARVHKERDGKIGLDEDHEVRKQKRGKFIKEGRILSCKELEANGFRFDERQRLTEEPQKALPVGSNQSEA